MTPHHPADTTDPMSIDDDDEEHHTKNTCKELGVSDPELLSCDGVKQESKEETAASESSTFGGISTGVYEEPKEESDETTTTTRSEGHLAKDILKKEREDDVQNEGVKLVIIELGCGDSLHSIRIEADLLIAEEPGVRLIRINPNFRGQLPEGHVALRLGALAALRGIQQCGPCDDV